MDKKGYKYTYTALGLIFGVAIGAGIGIIYNNIALFAGIGGGLGIVFGAIAQSSAKN